MDSEQETKLRAAAEDMAVPTSASKMLIHAAGLFDAVTVMLEILTTEEVILQGESKTLNCLVDLFEGPPDIQEDLRHLAKWLEGQPLLDTNLWIGTNAQIAHEKDNAQ